VQLFVDDFVRLGKVLTALGVADQGVRSADGDELTHRGFACLGAFFGKVNILRADRDIRGIACSDDRWQQYRGREQGDLVAGVAGNEGQKGVDESLGFSRSLEHLPISGNQSFTGHFLGFLMPILVDGIQGAG
jgi:hypothetical protein